jgi:hypothetical protein
MPEVVVPPKPQDRSPVKKKKKKKKSLQLTLIPAVKSSSQLNEALKGKYVGKRILLTAAFLYGRCIPAGEENLLFQYHVASVNDDNKTADIDYDERAIINAHHKFTSYPDVDGTESSIDNYDLGTFKEDHELYLQHLGRCNKVQYEAHQAQKNKEQEEAAAAAKDISDIHLKLENGVEAYELLKGEFEPSGPLRDHVVGKGAHKGKIHKKQTWSEFYLLFVNTLQCIVDSCDFVFL